MRRITRRGGLAALAVCIAAAAGPGPARAAERLPTASPESVGLSSERLARIAPAVQAYIDRGEIAGAVTLVARRGKVVHYEAHGYRDLETRTPMPKDALFRLASQTKPVTAASALILFERGELSLADPIARLIPDFAEMKVAEPLDPSDPARGRTLVPAERPITARHLLTHTSGLGSRGPGRLLTEADLPPPRGPGATVLDLVRDYAKVPLGFHPGAYWEYSPVFGINAVAALVEVVSGESFGAFTQAEIFGPLKMEDTHFYVPQTKLDRLPTAYRRTPEGGIEPADPRTAESRFVARDEPQNFFAGSGNLVSTAPDYFRFAQMLLNGGELDGVRVLGEKTVEMMAANHIGDTPALDMLGPGTRFGLAVSVLEDPGLAGTIGSPGTYGWGGATGVTFWIDPEEELIGLYMMQLYNHQPLRVRDEFRILTYAAITD
ncbi:MAG: beta-lactamase family protein [Alphaproteobacteria bacterium]|nr:beta-lactamase family protein [Alphaproteobacteria bacterium]